MRDTVNYSFGAFTSSVHFGGLPAIRDISALMEQEGYSRPLIVCDENTLPLADKISGNEELPRCLLKSGEEGKNWSAVESILAAARNAGLGRDAFFIGVGGGVIGDLSAFAASIYMRGCGICLVSTTLLGMVDAGLGGKTGFDLFGIKNLAGTFYPARHVFISKESLDTLPEAEWKSGMAELIKTAVIGGDDFLDIFTGLDPESLKKDKEQLINCIIRAVDLKGRIVEADPRETGKERILLNLGHTFGHALESSVGLGRLSHGEAVAWGMVRSCELGYSLGITPRERAEKIRSIIRLYGYEIRAPHPFMGDADSFIKALEGDKKKRAGALTFIVPDEKGARPVPAETAEVKQIISGALTF
jgi:3-dehydroquinate synthase